MSKITENVTSIKLSESESESVHLCPQVFSFVHAQFTFFHQGFDLLRDLEPTMKTMAAQVGPPPLPSVRVEGIEPAT